MVQIGIYLNFNGTTEEAFRFYRSVFGGEFTMMRFKDLPDRSKVAPGDEEKVLHISLPIGKNLVLMASDISQQIEAKFLLGNNMFIYIEADARGEAEMLFRKLSEGGLIEMPLTDTFWGAYFGSFTDKFGVQWMISFTKKS